MSAYIVEDATINAVISFLAKDRKGDYMRRQILEETGCDLETTLGREALGQAMFALNCNAVEQRYGDGEAKAFRDLDYKFALNIMASRFSAYKCLKCWLYQCSEGDVPDTSLLYAAMNRVKGEMADDIVSALPEYESAKGCNHDGQNQT
jgi:hypothetical protein